MTPTDFLEAAAEVRLADPRASALALEILGSTEAGAVAGAFRRVCRTVMGSEPAQVRMMTASSSLGAALELRDGAEVFVKLHRPHSTAEFLAAVHIVQRGLAIEGLACPQPYGRPLAVKSGFATVEELLPTQPPRSVRDAVGTEAMARELARINGLATPLGRNLPLPVAAFDVAERKTLWPTPNSPIVDYSAAHVTGKCEWIDELGLAALGKRSEAPIDIVSHGDWRKDNVSMSGDGQLLAVFDWDSLVRARETTLVGMAAIAFAGSDTVPYPNPREAWTFVRQYEIARGEPWTQDQRSAIGATMLWGAAWGARLELSDVSKQGRWGPNQQRLADHGPGFTVEPES